MKFIVETTFDEGAAELRDVLVKAYGFAGDEEPEPIKVRTLTTGSQLVSAEPFDGSTRRMALWVREQLSRVESLSSFRFKAVADGRVHDGLVKVQYSLTKGEYDTDATVGHSLAPTVEEFIRRQGWNAQNAPLAITYTQPEVPNDEVPF